MDAFLTLQSDNKNIVLARGVLNGNAPRFLIKVCSDTLQVKQSSHFLKAHTLLNIRIIHSSQTSSPTPQLQGSLPVGTNADSINRPDAPSPNVFGAASLDFSAMQLLKVMTRLTQRNDVPYLPYFMLCREMGAVTVNGMVKARILDLRWTDPLTEEYVDDIPPPLPEAVNIEGSTGGGGYGVENPITETRRNPYEAILEVVGPKLVPCSPIMRLAMRQVISEYEEEDGNEEQSEYASILDVPIEEY